MWFNELPDLLHLRVFGGKAMAHIWKEFRRKWDAKSEELIFLRYAKNKKGYRSIKPKTKKVLFSKDVTCFENSDMNLNKITSSEHLDEISEKIK